MNIYEVMQLIYEAFDKADETRVKKIFKSKDGRLLLVLTNGKEFEITTKEIK